MLKILQNKIRELLQSEKEPEVKELKIDELEPWLQEELSKLQFNSYIDEYFRQISDFRKKLNEKIQVLQQQEISAKDKQQVEARVQNIVIGHKEHYCQGVGRFAENLVLPKDDAFQHNAIQYYRSVMKFNKELNEKLNLLAKQTSKSYQASQHLFFDSVESIFKSLGELNLLVKNFEKESEARKLKKIESVHQLLTDLNEEIKRKTDFEKLIAEKKEKNKKDQRELEELSKQIQKLKQSDEFKDHDELLKKNEKLRNRQSVLDNEIFSFFSKLQKALKKYERVALDNKPIKPYIEDSNSAFWKDSEMKILQILQGLKNNLSNLDFDDKQKGKFLELIERSEKGYLRGLKERGLHLRKEQDTIEEEIRNSTINSQINKAESETKNISEKVVLRMKELNDLNLKLEKSEPQQIQNEFSTLTKEIFNVEVRIKNLNNNQRKV